MAEKTTTGLPRNTAAALSYVLFWFSGIIFLLIEKDPFIRFHAAQSIVVFGFLNFLLFVPFIGVLVLFPFSPFIFVFWLMLIYKAWLGDEWEVPFVGKYARLLLKKTKSK